MDDNAGRFYIDDGVMREAGQPVDMGSGNAAMIYEVIRIIDGIPLFFEDHYIRMCSSFQAIGNVCRIGASELKEQIHKIAEANENTNCNIKFITFAEGGHQRTLGYISKSHYPTQEEISNGVPVGLLSLERENPNIKLLDHNYKKRINEIKSQRGLYEVFLVDREGNVTEGGTSNIFFVKGEKIITAPEEKVLKGITRMHVIETCKSAGFEVIEVSIPADRLDGADGVFLSGTSPNVLPVSSIDDRKYPSAKHPIVNTIRTAFDARIKEYLTMNR